MKTGLAALEPVLGTIIIVIECFFHPFYIEAALLALYPVFRLAARQAVLDRLCTS